MLEVEEKKMKSKYLDLEKTKMGGLGQKQRQSRVGWLVGFEKFTF